MALPALLAAGLAVQGLSSVAQGILGITQADDAADLRSKSRPQYSIEDEYYDNVNLAANSAQFGLTQESKDFYAGQADRGLNRSIDAALRTGGGINSYAQLYDQYLQQNYRISAEDSQLRDAKIKNLIDEKKTLAGQKTQQWVLNELNPWKDSQQAAAAASAASTKNIFGALTGAASGLSSAATANAYEKLLLQGQTKIPATAPSVANTPVNTYEALPANYSTEENPVLYQAPEDDWITGALKKLQTTQLGNFNYAIA